MATNRHETLTQVQFTVEHWNERWQSWHRNLLSRATPEEVIRWMQHKRDRILKITTVTEIVPTPTTTREP